MLAHYTFKPFWFRNTPHWRQCVLADVADWMKFSAFLIESNDEVERYRVLIDADLFEDWAGPIHDTKGEMLWGLPDDGLVTEAPVTMIDVRRRVFKMIDDSTNLDWILRTRFPENIVAAWPVEGCTCSPRGNGHSDSCDVAGKLPRENVWIGTSISTQADADRNIPELLKCRGLSLVLFASVEPLIEEIDLCRYIGNGHPEHHGNGSLHNDPSECPLWYDWCNCPTLDWVIVGGESGPNARPCRVEWIQSLVDQCRGAGVPCFVKQLGSNVIGPNSSVDMMGRWETRDPKGGDPAEWPEDLRVREFPRGV